MSRAAPELPDETVSSSTPGSQSKPALLHLAPIGVRTDRAEVAAFARETGSLGGQDFVPLTYPIRWLTLPDVRRAISQALGVGFLPVHEGQRFEQAKNLVIDHDYELAIDLELTEKPSRLTIHMRVSDLEGRCCALETVLRIVPAKTDQGP